jgi:hypothetical protein
MSIEATAVAFVAATKKRAQARSHLSALRKKWLADNDAFWDKYESDGMEGHNDMLEALHDREVANAEYRRAKSKLFRMVAAAALGLSFAQMKALDWLGTQKAPIFSREYRRAGITTTTINALRMRGLIGDAYDVGGNYWFVTDAGRTAIDGVAIPQPTEEKKHG